MHSGSITKTTIENVVIICHIGRAGYNVIRALRALGVHPYLIYGRLAYSLRWSRGCQTLYHTQDLTTIDTNIIVDQINKLHSRTPISLVIPCDFVSSFLLSSIRDRLHPAIFPVPDTETLSRLDNKWEFCKICMSLGIAVPKTFYFETNQTFDAATVAAQVGYPFIIKPVVGFGQHNIHVVRTVAEARKFQAASSHQNGFVVQEYVEGTDWALSAVARDGIITNWVTWECPDQLTTNNVTRFATTAFRPHAGLLDIGRRLLAHVKYCGVVNFDARLSRDGRMLMLECNPRFFNRMHSARLCGQDFVAAGMNVESARLQETLKQCDFYPWQDLFTFGGWRRLLTGEWKLSQLFTDLWEMACDPLPPLIRKLTTEENDVK